MAAHPTLAKQLQGRCDFGTLLLQCDAACCDAEKGFHILQPVNKSDHMQQGMNALRVCAVCKQQEKSSTSGQSSRKGKEYMNEQEREWRNMSKSKHDSST